MNTSSPKVIGGIELKQCPACSRRFTPNRIKTHEAICQKSALITRKLFDSSHQRIGGTEFEKAAKNATKTVPVIEDGLKLRKGPTPLATNWRQKHEEFLLTVRNYKKEDENKETCSKGSDLPLKPVLNCDDYVQCPHCLRQFNPPSAERHILTCEKVMHEQSKSKDCLSVSTVSKLSEVDVAEK